MTASWQGKSAIVLGGSTAVGRQLARVLVAAGAEVALGFEPDDHDQAVTDALVAECDPLAGGITVYPCAMSRNRDAASLMQSHAAKVETLDLLAVVSLRQTASPASLMEYQSADFIGELDVGSWPLIAFLHAANKQFGGYPRYALALSHDAHRLYDPAATYSGLAASVLETFAKYMATHLRENGTLVNVLRLPVGSEAGGGDSQIAPTAQQVAAVAMSMTSGAFDSMSGQVVDVDGGRGYLPRPMGSAGE